MQAANQRNCALDVLKCLGAFWVVMTHCTHLDGDNLYTDIVLILAQSFVLVFFMITGYYLPVIIEKGKELIYIKKIIILTFTATAFYFVYRIVVAGIQGNALQWIIENYSLGRLFCWVIFCDDPSAFHLWYLYSLIYTLVFYFLIYKYRLTHLILPVTLLLTVFCIANNYLSLCFTRDYILAIPCVGCGILAHNKQIAIKSWKLIVIIICAFVFILVEKFFDKANCLNESAFIYTFSLPFALSMLLLALNNPAFGLNTIVAKIGLKHSAHIYIYHIFVSYLVGLMLIMDSLFLKLIYPIIIFILTALLSFAYNKTMIYLKVDRAQYK